MEWDPSMSDDRKSSTEERTKVTKVPKAWVPAKTKAGVAYYTLIIPKREPSIRFDLRRMLGLRDRA